jgi:hypothetical protein
MGCSGSKTAQASKPVEKATGATLLADPEVKAIKSEEPEVSTTEAGSQEAVAASTAEEAKAAEAQAPADAKEEAKASETAATADADTAKVEAETVKEPVEGAAEAEQAPEAQATQPESEEQGPAPELVQKPTPDAEVAETAKEPADAQATQPANEEQESPADAGSSRRQRSSCC